MAMQKRSEGSDSIAALFLYAALYVRASTQMRKKMRTTFRALERVAKEGRWGKITPATFTPKQFRLYIAARKGKVSDRTLQNEASHLRRALAGAGRDDVADGKCTSEAMGVPSATRIGRGKVVDLTVLAAALRKAREDTKAIILLSHSMGLRGREAVQCGESLREWKRAIAAGQPVTVRYGTKGGRVRSVFLCPSKAAEAAVAVDAALAVLEKQAYLVDAKNLKAALAMNHRRLKKIGLASENSLHSLRRSFALTQFDYYCGELILKEKVALSRLAGDLGHGDGRGRWVFNCYLKASLEERNVALAEQKSKPTGSA